MRTELVQLLGPPQLRPTGEERPLERRQAALLAYLCLQGPTPRERLAGLLWPDSGDEAARANLRQALRRLRKQAPELLPEGADPLELAPEATLDLRTLLQPALARPGATEEVPAGELLAGFDYAELDALSEWLYAARTRVRARQQQLLSARAEEAEKQGDHPAAVAALRRALEVEPLSEELQRRLMRALHRAGDGPAALASFERFRLALEQELGVRPAGPTLALAAELARAPAARRAAPAAPEALPLAILRPPFVGREREWARMEAAWANNQNILLTGPSGVGKSRLMHEFVHAHAQPLLYRALPTDRQLPYGTHARTFLQVVRQVGEESLPGWVRDELARIIPGLGRSPGPMRDEQDRLRFLLAKVEAFRPLVARGFNALGFDDTQWVDEESAAAGAFIQQHLQGEVKTVHVGRKDLFPAQTREVLEQAIAAGLVVEVELGPLDEEALGRMLAGTGVEGGAELSGEVYRLTGGNPMLALEALRARLAGAPVAAAGAGGAVHPVVASRLAALSAQALLLARATAVLGKQFTLERARKVLDARPLEALGWWGELQRAQVVREAGLAHDLLREALLAGLPQQVATVLHQQTARVLEDHGAPPGIIAEHYTLAGEPQLAAPFLLAAAKSARDALLLDKAARFQAQAAAATP